MIESLAYLGIGGLTTVLVVKELVGAYFKNRLLDEIKANTTAIRELTKRLEQYIINSKHGEHQ